MHHRIRPAVVLVLLGALAAALLPSSGSAQTEPRVGIADRPIGVHALVGATVILAPGETVENATVIVRDGVVEAVGSGLAVPADARVWDLAGRTITAGWIDLDLRVAVTLPGADASREGRAWNDRIHPETDVAEGLRIAEDAAKKHRAAGFALALASPERGILAGQAALVRLTGRDDRRTTIDSGLAQIAALEHGGWGDSGYPGSRMGAVALLRQTLLDAEWYRESWAQYDAAPGEIPRPEVNRSLAALQPALAGEQPVALRSRDATELLAIASVAKEFGLGSYCFGSGEEQLWLEPVRALGLPIVLPVTYPETPVVDGPGGDTEVTLRELELWARAPENAVRLSRAGARFAFTPRGLDDPKDFAARVRTSIDRGLAADAALAAVTTEPARIIGRGDRFGEVRPGRAATLTVLDGAPFAEETKVIEVWIDGERFPVDAAVEPDLRGTWDLTLVVDPAAPATILLEIGGGKEKPRVTAKLGEEEVEPAALHRQGNEVGLTLGAAAIGEEEGYLRLGGVYGGGETFEGTARTPSGASIRFMAHRTGEPKAAEGRDRPGDGEGDEAKEGAEERGAEGRGEKKGREKKDAWAGSADEPLPTPLGARGRVAPPAGGGTLLITGATIWTCTGDGVLEDASLLVRDGKIVALGPDLPAPDDATVIDAAGRHITPGIIDPHSHTAIAGGVNEGTQAVTAEVRIGDAVDPDDINIYRQLAGGVTSAQLLHGSANPIGGQSQVIKLRWGEPAAGLRVEGPKLIKCALGENVKQSNWDDPTGRYPQTRMGVEQVFRDAFWAARQYRAERERWQSRNGGVVPRPRVDLELEALAEILAGERLIHCHSYRQDEILMLIRVAEEFGFRVGTFQHVLEGYKVAEEIARHGAGASSFSDWWAYKFEVYDAIPHNGALLWRAGVLTSFNSDSDELARRLNLEAAKAVKYGGVPREEALDFVTRNPAIQIAIGDRTGSLEPGKDADFVIWTGDPLSTYSVCDETWIDGRCYYSRAEDAELRARDTARRETLIARILAEKHGSRGREKPEKKEGEVR